MDRQEIYASLAEEYGFDISVVNHCVETLSFYDFARDGEEEQFLTCLEMVLQSLCTMEFMTEHKHKYAETNIKHIFFDALYRVYGELAIPYMDQEYLELNESRI
jgi:hypothetical protein